MRTLHISWGRMLAAGTILGFILSPITIFMYTNNVLVNVIEQPALLPAGVMTLFIPTILTVPFSIITAVIAKIATSFTSTVQTAAATLVITSAGTITVFAKLTNSGISLTNILIYVAVTLTVFLITVTRKTKKLYIEEI